MSNKTRSTKEEFDGSVPTRARTRADTHTLLDKESCNPGAVSEALCWNVSVWKRPIFFSSAAPVWRFGRVGNPTVHTRAYTHLCAPHSFCWCAVETAEHNGSWFSLMQVGQRVIVEQRFITEAQQVPMSSVRIHYVSAMHHMRLHSTWAALFTIRFNAKTCTFSFIWSHCNH